MSGSTKNAYAVAGKVALVTGGGSGIGRAIARGFLDNGANVAVLGRRAERLEETLDGYAADRTLAIAGNVASREDVDDAVARTLERFGRLDIVVSDAAAYFAGDLLDVDEESWRAMFATNVDGLFHLVKATLPALRESRGNLVAISSVSGSFGDWGQAAYNSSKHAINGLIRSLALDEGRHGVRFNAVAPAFTLTDMTEGVGRSEEDLAPFINRIALGRPGTPADVVGAVLFLASPDAAYVTGSVLTVDGGTSASTGQPHIE